MPMTRPSTRRARTACAAVVTSTRPEPVATPTTNVPASASGERARREQRVAGQQEHPGGAALTHRGGERPPREERPDGDRPERGRGEQQREAGRTVPELVLRELRDADRPDARHHRRAEREHRDRDSAGPPAHRSAAKPSPIEIRGASRGGRLPGSRTRSNNAADTKNETRSRRRTIRSRRPRAAPRRASGRRP